MLQFSEFFELLMEDRQSSVNQAKTILTNNNAGENISFIISKLEDIYDQVQFEDEQHRTANKDSNIPALAFWFIADSNYARIAEDYRQYINTRSLYSKNFLINSMETLKKEISAKKLFKPSEEKLSLIKNTFSKVAETIHSQYKPPVKATDKKFVPGSTNDDVVYEDDKITVYRADSKAKCIQYGTGSSLCISTKGGGNYYWSYRMGNMHPEGLGMTTYFVYWKDGSNRILIDALGDEDGPANKYSWNPITPNTDRDVGAMGLIKQYPELEEPFLKDVFQFIPYGEVEKRYQYIETYVHSISDERLKTLEDYEMFIESMEDNEINQETGVGNTYIPINDFEKLETKLGQESVRYLVKKCSGLANIIDIKTQEKYLTPQDIEWYQDVLIREFDVNDDYFEYFKILKKNIPHKLIEEYFTNYYNRDFYLDDKDEAGPTESIGEFIKAVIIGTKDVHVWDVAENLLRYATKANLKLSDFFLGKNVTPELVSYVFNDFNVQKGNYLPDLLLLLIKYYKNNNIQVPRILYKCIANDPYLAAKYLYTWYINRLNNHKTVGMPNQALLRQVASKKSTAYYLLNTLKYYINAGKLEFGIDIPTSIMWPLERDPYYKEFVSLIKTASNYDEAESTRIN